MRRSPTGRTLLLGFVALSLVGAGCSDDDDDASAVGGSDATLDATAPPGTAVAEGPDAITCGNGGVVTDDLYSGSDLSDGYDAEQGPLGSVEPPVQDELPERIPTTPFPTVADDQVIVVESFGLGQGAFHLVDPVDGSLGYVNVATGADIWAPVGGLDDLMAVVGSENFRPRGARGVRESVVTFFDLNGHAVGEICLPRNQYSSVGSPIPAMTLDGAHVVVYDQRLTGYLLIDVDSREVVDELVVDPACQPGIHFADATTGYVVCWRTGEIMEVTVDDGSIEAGDVAAAFEPETPVLDNSVRFSPTTGLMTILTRFSEVLPVDLSEGLPSAPVDPVDLGEADHIVRAGQTFLTPDGSKLIVGYVEGDDYGSGTATLWRVFDTATYDETVRPTFPDGDLAAVLPTPTSGEVYVLTNGIEVPPEEEGDEPEEITLLTTFDLTTGDEVTRVELATTTDGREFTALYNPLTVGAG